jgi:hypothetical protein
VNYSAFQRDSSHPRPHIFAPINGVETVFVGNYYEVGFGMTPSKYQFTGQYSNVPEFGLYYYNAMTRFKQQERVLRALLPVP